jgi:hypothetical protein
MTDAAKIVDDIIRGWAGLTGAEDEIVMQESIAREKFTRAIEEAEARGRAVGKEVIEAAQGVVAAHAAMQQRGGSVVPIELHEATAELQETLDSFSTLNVN